MPKKGSESFHLYDLKDKVLLFDFDGTLVETEGLAQQVIEHYFVEKNFPIKLPFAELIVGRTWEAATKSMVEFAKSKGFDIGPSKDLHGEFKKRYRVRFEKGVRLIPGVMEVLPKLQQISKFMGIVTGSERDEVDTILNEHHLGQFFSRIWAFGDYEHSKPNPSPFLKAMSDLGAAPEDTFIFEDSKAGMEAAFQAKVKWIQIAHEAHSLSIDPRSVMVISDWRELLKT